MVSIYKQKVIVIGTLILCALLTSCTSMAKDSAKVVVVKTLNINGNKEQVWAALTKSSELALWWNKDVKLEPFMGGEFYEPWGDGQLATGKVLSVEPLKSIRFTWREKTWSADQQSFCEFYLDEKDGGTVLTVRHSGWESFAEAQHQFADGFSKGWDFLLPKLKSYLEAR